MTFAEKSSLVVQKNETDDNFKKSKNTVVSRNKNISTDVYPR